MLIGKCISYSIIIVIIISTTKLYYYIIYVIYICLYTIQYIICS